MAGRQLPFVSLIVPAWLVVTMSGWRGLRGVWPAVLVCGGTFAVVQFAWSNYVGPELVDIVGGLASIAALALFCRVWQPADVWEFRGRRPCRVAAIRVRAPDRASCTPARVAARVTRRGSLASQCVARAWMPWVFLSVAVIVWGLAAGEGVPLTPAACSRPPWNVPLLHRMVFRDYPVVPAPVDPRADRTIRRYRNERAEAARVHASTGRRRRHGDPARRDRDARCSCACRRAQFLAVAGADAAAHALAARDDHADAGARLRHALRRHRRDARPGVHADRLALSVLRGAARLARRGADRLGHELERAVRQPAEDHRAAARVQPDPDRRPPTAPAASWAR